MGFEALTPNAMQQCQVFDRETGQMCPHNAVAMVIARGQFSRGFWVCQMEAHNYAQSEIVTTPEDGPKIQRLMIAIDTLQQQAKRLQAPHRESDSVTEREQLRAAKEILEKELAELKARQPFQPYRGPANTHP